MLQNGTIMPPKKHYYAGIMLDAPHLVLCSKLCRHNVSTPTYELFSTRRTLSAWKGAIQGSEAELVFLAVADVIQ